MTICQSEEHCIYFYPETSLETYLAQQSKTSFIFPAGKALSGLVSRQRVWNHHKEIPTG